MLMRYSTVNMCLLSLQGKAAQSLNYLLV